MNSTTLEPVREVRQLKMHERLLYNVILKQAGSLAKAFLEGIMNSIDAGSPYCDIALTKRLAMLEDGGRGIVDLDEIERFFDTFGQPHKEEENKVYAKFRMGRGQLFAYGRNKWRTGPFEMDVDIKGKGLQYDLTTHPDNASGCLIEVELYDELLPSDFAETERLLQHWVRYAPIPVTVNGELYSGDPEREKWDFVTDEAYIRLDSTATLSIYNLGIWVMDSSAHRFGTGGTVVSRKQLDVNFARNDITSTCPVWKKVRPLINQTATEKNLSQAGSLDNDARQRLVDQFLQGELGEHDFSKLRLFTSVGGAQHTFQQLCCQDVLSVAPKGSRLGDKLHKSKTAFILSSDTLDRFGVRSVEALVAKVSRLVHRCFDPRCVDFEEISAGMSDKYMIVPVAEYTAMEKVWIKLVESCKWALELPREFEVDLTLPRNLPSGRSGCAAQRQTIIGTSDCCNGWTDSSTYVAIDRSFLKRLKVSISGFNELGRLMLHEYCHNTPDTVDHDHDQAFYEQFHDAVKRGSLGNFNEQCFGTVPLAFQQVGRQLTKAINKQRDRQVAAKQAHEKFDAIVADAATQERL